MLSGLEYQRINGRETAYRQYAWDITTTGLLIAASFTFSWMFLAFPMIVGNLGGTAEENRDNLNKISDSIVAKIKELGKKVVMFVTSPSLFYRCIIQGGTL